MKRVAATALLAIGLLYGVVAAAAPDTTQTAQAAAEQARAAAARELHAQPSEFTVVTIEPAQWSDSSLGCRKPNAMYQEVISSGYVVVLERDGTRHQVNVAGSRAVMCEPSTRLTGTVRQPLGARGLDRMTALARQDLANRLHLDAQQIHVASTQPRRWTDDDMNCASGGGESATAVPGAPRETAAIGYRLALTASGRTYFYHTDLRSIRACPPIPAQ